MRLISLLYVASVFALSTGTHAADAEGNYAIWGMGNSSCHSYSEARAKDEADGFRYFVMGYLTAYNVHQKETYSISATQPMPEIMAWFDDFCSDNAIHSFENALKNYVSENYEERMKTPPNAFSR